MKILRLAKIFTLLFAFSLLIVSCSKDPEVIEDVNPGQIDPTEEIDQNSLLTRTVNDEDGLALDCITVLFPFSVVDSEGETYEITTFEDFEALIDEDGTTYIVDFVYPLNISHEDGTESTVNDAEELGASFANCLPNGWETDAFPAYLINAENSCLSLVYPVTVSKLDGTIATYDDEESFVAALAEEPLFFVFPLSLMNEDEEVIVTESIDELLTALFDCNGLEIDTTIWDGGTGFDYIGCYELQFPFSVELIDGTVVEVNDHMEYCDLLLEGNIAGFSFPLTLVGEEGEIEVNSQEELDALLEECWDIGTPGELFGDLLNLFIGSLSEPDLGIVACYEIQFPIAAQEVDFEGNVLDDITIDSQEELNGIFENGTITTIYNVVYPITVTMTSTGETVELNSAEELIELLVSCQ